VEFSKWKQPWSRAIRPTCGISTWATYLLALLTLELVWGVGSTLNCPYLARTSGKKYSNGSRFLVVCNLSLLNLLFCDLTIGLSRAMRVADAGLTPSSLGFQRLLKTCAKYFLCCYMHRVAIRQVFPWHVRDFGINAFYEILPQCFHSKNYLVLKIKLCNFLLLKKAKRKCKVTDEMTAIHPCFRKSKNEWEAECLVCKPGTYISVSYKVWQI